MQDYDKQGIICVSMKHKPWVINGGLVHAWKRSQYFAFTYGLALMADVILMHIGQTK